MNTRPDSAENDLLTRRLLAPPVGGRARVVVVVAVVITVVVIETLDYLSGSELSIGVFYLLPVIAAAVLISARAAFWFSGLSAASWATAEYFQRSPEAWAPAAWNGVLRFLTFSIVVVLLSRLRAAIAAADASSRAAKAFLSAAAHQLRTPVAGLVALADAVAVEEDETTRKELAETIGAATARVSRLLSALLELSRVDQGFVGPPTAVLLAPLVDAQRSVLAATRDVEVVVDVPDGLAVSASADAVHEALGNLIDNAGRHAARTVLIRARAEGPTISLDVCDDGPGVPVGSEEAVFDRFVTMDGLGGTGLGLPIARGLARAQGGNVVAIRGGFCLTLPAAEAGSSASSGTGAPVRPHGPSV